MQSRWQDFGQFFSDCAQKFGDETALSFFNKGSWEHLSYRDLERAALAVARGLVLSGFAPGSRVALLSTTSMDSVVFLCGAFISRVTVTPLDPKGSEGEHSEILKRLQPQGIFVSREFFSLAIHLGSEVGSEKVLCLEDKVPESFLTHLPLPSVESQHPAAIFFTSGTQGKAKGVIVSPTALLFELTALTKLRENHPWDVIFSILPINHIYGVTAGFLYAFACGCEYVIAHSLAPEEIGRCLRDRRVTQMTAVPLLMNVMRRGILSKIKEQPVLRQKLVGLFLVLGPWLTSGMRKKLFSSIHEKLGGALARVVCGAAPLEGATQRFFKAIGIPIYVGYGLTETGPVVSVNTTRYSRTGSVGRILPGVELKIERDDESSEVGEVLVKGPNVMEGYFRDADATDQVLSKEGWFRTGDLGYLSDSYLFISGRKKSLIVLGSGKKVHPEEVEMAIGSGGQFPDVCVLGIPFAEQGEQVVAVVYPSEEFRRSHPGNLEQGAAEAVGLLCRKLAPYKRPMKVVVAAEPLPKTTSQKVKRNEVRALVR